MSKKPVTVFRLGFIKASVWLNRTRAGDRYHVTIVRLYRNGDTWSESTHYSRDDLPLVAKVADQAHTWIFQEARALTERTDNSAET